MESNHLIVEALNLLLERRQHELAAAEAARQAAEDALGAATATVHQARRGVEEVFQMIASNTPGIRGDREIGSAWTKQGEGPMVPRLIELPPLPQVTEQVELGEEYVSPLRERWEAGYSSRQPRAYLRRTKLWKDQVVTHLMQILANGHRSSAHGLLLALIDAGISFDGIANPSHRLVQIMSADPRFESNRAEGWGLKKENPEAPGFPATTSAEDEL